jgi:hypothetical protein
MFAVPSCFISVKEVVKAPGSAKSVWLHWNLLNKWLTDNIFLKSRHGGILVFITAFV